MSQRPSPGRQVIEEASDWFLDMREADSSLQQRAAFAEWLRASPLHVQAYLDVSRLWGEAAQISSDFPVAVDPAGADIIPIGTRDRTRREAARTVKPRWFAVAASLGACVLAGTAWLIATRSPSYSADVAEQRVITLEDGSIVKLNSRSRFSVHMTPKRREIELLEGQAYFEVAHDTSRPFIVKGGDVAVRAVGTQFDVNIKKSGTVVSVVEGRVAVVPTTTSASALGLNDATGRSATARSRTARRSKGGDTPVETPAPDHVSVTPALAFDGNTSGGSEIFLVAGEQAASDNHGTLHVATKADIVAATSWTEQELIFQGESLSEVVEVMNRYSRKRIVLSDPSLAGLQINAVFHTTSPESLLHFIEQLDHVEVQRSDDEILIRRKP